MKVLYLHQYFNTPGMPGSTRSYEFAKQLVLAGHQVTVCTSIRSSSRSKEMSSVIDGIRIVWLPNLYDNSFSYLKRIKAFVGFALQAAYAMRREECDVVFATSTPLTIAFPGILLSRLRRRPLVFEVRDRWPAIPIELGIIKNPILTSILRSIEKQVYNEASVVIALSPEMQASIISRGIPSDKLVCIPNGANPLDVSREQERIREFRDSRPWLRESRFIMYAGTLGLVNGLDYLIELASELKTRGSDLKVVLIGDGREKNRLVSLATERNVLDTQVFFEPSIPKKSIEAAFLAAFMTAHTVLPVRILWENSANKFFDSLAAARPVLYNQGGWIHEEIEHYRCGITGWNRSIPDVASEMISLASNDTLYQEMCHRAQRLSTTKYNWKILSKKFISVLTEAEHDHRTMREANNISVTTRQEKA